MTNDMRSLIEIVNSLNDSLVEDVSKRGLLKGGAAAVAAALAPKDAQSLTYRTSEFTVTTLGENWVMTESSFGDGLKFRFNLMKFDNNTIQGSIILRNDNWSIRRDQREIVVELDLGRNEYNLLFTRQSSATFQAAFNQENTGIFFRTLLRFETQYISFTTPDIRTNTAIYSPRSYRILYSPSSNRTFTDAALAILGPSNPSRPAQPPAQRR